MLKVREVLTPGSRACLGELRDVLIIAPAIRGKKGNAAYAAARRALKDAGVKKVRALGRLVKMAKEAV